MKFLGVSVSSFQSARYCRKPSELLIRGSSLLLTASLLVLKKSIAALVWATS